MLVVRQFWRFFIDVGIFWKNILQVKHYLLMRVHSDFNFSFYKQVKNEKADEPFQVLVQV